MSDQISTETISQRFAAIEEWTSADLVSAMVEGQFAAIAAVQSAAGQLAAAIDASAERLAGGGRLVYLGAGTSGRIAAQDAAELPPTFGWPYERAIALMAGGQHALAQAAEGAEDDEALAVADLERTGVSAGDVVIALAASGRTPYAVAGLVRARQAGALTIGIFNNRGGRLGEVCDIPVLLDTGAELLAGSTRMKAGTAQKAALNCISTGLMVRLGHVHRGLMVEMRPTNAKLRDRAARMVARLTGADYETALATLDAADGSIKLATLMLDKSVDFDTATGLLAAAGGDLRKALA